MIQPDVVGIKPQLFEGAIFTDYILEKLRGKRIEADARGGQLYLEIIMKWEQKSSLVKKYAIKFLKNRGLGKEVIISSGKNSEWPLYTIYRKLP